MPGGLPMARALWRERVIAQSDAVERVEGNVYFPADSVDQAFLVPSDHTTECSWKGTARYYTLRVGGVEYVNAAWYYPDPKQAASHIRGHVAFYDGVTIEDEAGERAGEL